MHKTTLLRVALLGLALGACPLAMVRAEDKLQYNRDIRPILVENCFACHGADSAARKADLRLDKRDAAVEYGAISPGKPDASALLERILSDDADVMMPPQETKKRLTADQKDKLRKWVAEGAEYEPHWSLIPPVRPTPSTVKDKAWGKFPIDAFVLSKLEAAGLKPAAEADRRTLARRLSLDLVGLPPQPGLVEEFVNDKDPKAYEKLVDRLMESPHWGEHRGRYWLDAARYADTHGIHFDNYREIWAYRDWVIDAFNQNIPFDQFTIEQLAGDLLPNASLEQQVATGFVRCNITTNEGGIIDEEYAVLYARDRTETFGHVFLGMTAGCAVCHDHKFDPLSTKEFYSLSAFFNNTTQAVKDGNVKDTPPVVVVPAEMDRPRWDAVQGDIAQLRGTLDSRKRDTKADFDHWLASATPKELQEFIPHAGLRLKASLNEGKGKSVTVSVDGEERKIEREEAINWGAGREAKQKALSLQTSPAIEIPEAGNFDEGQGFTASIWVRLDRANQTGAILARMDNGNQHRGWDLWLEGDKIGTHIVSKWPEDALKVVVQTPLARTKWTHVCVSYDGSKKASGVKIYFNGRPQAVSVKTDQLKGSIRTAVPFKIGQRNTDQQLKFMTVSDLKLFSRGVSPLEAAQLGQGDEIEQIVAKAAADRTAEEKSKANDWWLTAVDSGSREIDAQIRTLQEEEAQLKGRGTIAHVMNEKQGEPIAYVLYRGEYDQRRDQVPAVTPAALPAMPKSLPDNRLGLAQWLLRPEHPLTARVTINRYWQELFGTGIVRTSGDFGVTGELPSHPELLDWLAVEFRESGWDVKKFFKLLVTSNAYKQAAIVTPEKMLKDADNRLLSRGARFRMDAEMVRDYALAASGLLVRKLGGPSVRPYQPEGVWEAVAMIGSNTRDYKRDSGESLYRRSMYTFWKRAAPPASMEILNAPNRETTCVRRERTDTPLQALVTLNDVQFVEAARHLAEVVLKKAEKDDERLQELSLRVLSRPFRAKELTIVKGSLAHLVDHYQAHADEAKQLVAVGESKADESLDVARLAAWTMLANEVLNLDEVLNK